MLPGNLAARFAEAHWSMHHPSFLSLSSSCCYDTPLLRRKLEEQAPKRRKKGGASAAVAPQPVTTVAAAPAAETWAKVLRLALHLSCSEPNPFLQCVYGCIEHLLM